MPYGQFNQQHDQTQTTAENQHQEEWQQMFRREDNIRVGQGALLSGKGEAFRGYWDNLPWPNPTHSRLKGPNRSFGDGPFRYRVQGRAVVPHQLKRYRIRFR